MPDIMETERDITIRICKEAARIAQEKTSAEIREALSKRPDFIKMFEEIEAATLKHQETAGKIAKTIQEKYKLRFEVFKRDGFRCQYCGRSPKTDENVILHLDHIHPKSKGGSDSKENLTTSCLECNVGKSNTILEES